MGTPDYSNAISGTPIIANLVIGTPVDASATCETLVAATLVSETTDAATHVSETTYAATLVSETTDAATYEHDAEKAPSVFNATINTARTVQYFVSVPKGSSSQNVLPVEDTLTAINVLITVISTPNPEDLDNKPTRFYSNTETVFAQNGIIADNNIYGINVKKEKELDHRDPTLADLNIIATSPKYQQFVIFSERKKSFQNSPQIFYKNRKVFSKAGFFYNGSILSEPGVNVSDKLPGVVCFCCGLMLYEPSPDIWSLHAALATNCPYVLLQKGRADVEDTSCHGSKEEKQNTKTGTSSYNKGLEEDVAVKLLVQEGYDLQKVIEAADQLKQEGKTFSSDDLLLRLDPEKARCQLSDKCRKLKEEIVLMRKIQICQTCQENPVQVVYLPCGHFLSCADCAMIEGLIKNACKACQKPVIGLVRATLTKIPNNNECCI
ncbi:E3 ubiquitin-protein ligase XIAP-like [Biomphalaria glabrata]|uniref:E3 ubiquitin-protein ligase XIAP-like n=1 Tax=Biomphalaria glabrata TaxID=6526 RepID=A0A9W3A448_BIOGL|nr:E3 ubiquitin-protein ligase XIAP-like [Biomphalaria glabrata]